MQLYKRKHILYNIYITITVNVWFSTDLSLAAESVLVEDFGVGSVIYRYAAAHTLSPEISTSQRWRLLQKHQAVAMEATLEPARRCHVAQGLGEPWSETEEGRNRLSGTFEGSHVFLIRGALTGLQKLPALPHWALAQDRQAQVITQQRLLGQHMKIFRWICVTDEWELRLGVTSCAAGKTASTCLARILPAWVNKCRQRASPASAP